MNIDFYKMNNDASLQINKNKLKNELISLQMTLKYELDKIEKDGDNYSPSNELGIVSSKGATIDNLIGKISELHMFKAFLNDIDV
jgi:hypothetical protein